DTRLLRDNILMAGVPVDYYEYADMMHVWPIFPMPEADEVNQIIAAAIQQDMTRKGSEG
ncbi:MAG: hypothetical protein H7X86_01315, partial [Gorillibacterium sp.]|nr:hypothetical protein [Gorillibacterium sp.]